MIFFFFFFCDSFGFREKSKKSFKLNVKETFFQRSVIVHVIVRNLNSKLIKIHILK